MRVTVDMISSFEETKFGRGCINHGHYCTHSPFLITLKDGRKATASIESIEVCRILTEMEAVGPSHFLYGHFRKYSSDPNFPYLSAENILTRLFAENMSQQK